MVAICNKLEAEIAELEDEERLEFLSDLGMSEPGLDRVIRLGIDCLAYKLISQLGQKRFELGLCAVGQPHHKPLA